MYMDCSPLPVVTIFPHGPDITVYTARRTGPVDEPLTVFFDAAGSPSLFRCVPNGDSFTFEAGRSVHQFTAVLPKGPPNFPAITVTLRETEDYQVGSPGSATKPQLDCG
jgi:hypothetical protein